MSTFKYQGRQLREISFPMGGIGTGCIGLGGDGRLRDWEIFNRPNKNSLNGFSHFAIRAEAGGKVIDARILHGDLQTPYTGSPWGESFRGVGFGPPRETLAGMPHFRDTVFTGKYPMAEIQFREKNFPGRVTLTAFNPFIPHEDDDSGIPAAFFEFAITNNTPKTIDYTLAATLGNPLPADQIHRFGQDASVSFLTLGSNGVPDGDPAFGDLTLATNARRVSCQKYWFRGGWFDSLEVYWRDLNTPCPLKARDYSGSRRAADNAPGTGNQGLLAAHLSISPGKTRTVRFVISWSFPFRENDWNKAAVKLAEEAGIPHRWRNYYATLWRNSAESALYALRNWSRLYDETRSFRDALFASHLPREALDAISANLSILKTPTVMRLEDGTFYGFEGCHGTAGCCEGTCTHVWNYAQALPFLFPALARTVREADFRYNHQPDGGMPFRLQLPLGISHPGGRSCADGLFGNVMMVYRDWKLSGDDDWLRTLWPAVKKSIAFAWNPGNEDRWDPDKSGVLRGRQHHTLDMELFGPNSWLTGFYLGALKAAAEMAEYLGEEDVALEYRALFEKGKAWVDMHLFNGEYYHQKIGLTNRNTLKKYDAVQAYWDGEHGEIKYQLGEGCGVDQVLAQYHANLYGLGTIFDPEQTRKALKSIFRYNFVKSMREVYNPCRIYALNDDSGLVIAAWPEGRPKPAIPLTYAQETMHGFEYAAAVQMIQNGMIKEGMAVVKGVRDRYDGESRNPWNEFECGSNYARSMASYALLNAFSGFRFDAPRGNIGFFPVHLPDGRFRCFWSLDSGWGEFDMRPGVITLRVLHGKVSLRTFAVPLARGSELSGVSLGGSPIAFQRHGDVLAFARKVTVRKGQSLRVRLTQKRRWRRSATSRWGWDPKQHRLQPAWAD